MTFDITSPANDRIKHLVRLGKRRHRSVEGVFLVEGSRLVQRAMNAGLVLTELYVDGSTPMFGDLHPTTVEPSVLDKVSYRSRSEGVVGVFEQINMNLDTITVGPTPLVLVAEEIEKPGNLGAILRTADAAGASAVLVLGEAPDFFNPNTVRASTGALFTVPIGTGTHEEIAHWLKARDIHVVGAVPGVAERIWDLDLTGSTALVVGSEHQGMTATAKAICDRLACIPMSGTVDSLNASVSLAVMTFEAVRQRSF